MRHHDAWQSIENDWTNLTQLDSVISDTCRRVSSTDSACPYTDWPGRFHSFSIGAAADLKEEKGGFTKIIIYLVLILRPSAEMRATADEL